MSHYIDSSALMAIAQHCLNLSKAPAILGLCAINKHGEPPKGGLKRGAQHQVEVSIAYGAQGNPLLHLKSKDAELDLPLHLISDIAQDLRALCLGLQEAPVSLARPLPEKVFTSADALKPVGAPSIPDAVVSRPLVTAGTSLAQPAILSILRTRGDVTVAADDSTVVFHGKQGMGVADQLKGAGYKWDVRASKDGVNRWILKTA